jgi:hypothetical protein
MIGSSSSRLAAPSTRSVPGTFVARTPAEALGSNEKDGGAVEDGLAALQRPSDRGLVGHITLDDLETPRQAERLKHQRSPAGKRGRPYAAASSLSHFQQKATACFGVASEPHAAESERERESLSTA